MSYRAARLHYGLKPVRGLAMRIQNRIKIGSKQSTGITYDSMGEIMIQKEIRK